MASWIDDIGHAIASQRLGPMKNAPTLGQLGSAITPSAIANAISHPSTQWPFSALGGSPSTPAEAAWNKLQSQPLTAAQAANPSSQLVQQYAQALGALPVSQAQKDAQSLPSSFATAVQNYLSTGGQSPQAQAGQAGQGASGYQYGFDPLSLANIWQTSGEPAIEANQKDFGNQINNYATQMSAALKGASPQIQQAYAATEPGIQYAATTENQAAGNLAQLSPAIDSLIQNLSDATTAAKSAQVYSEIEPYTAGLYQTEAGAYGAGTTGSAVGALGVPTAATTTPTGTTPFQYGTPGAPAAGTVATNPTTTAQNNLALQSAALAGAQPTP